MSTCKIPRPGLNRDGPELEQVVHTHPTSCRNGWPKGFGALNPSLHSWIFTSTLADSRPRFRRMLSVFLVSSYFCLLSVLILRSPSLHSLLQVNQGSLSREKDPGERRGVLPNNRLMEMCRWIGSHFSDWVDYNGVVIFNRVTRMGSHIFGILRVRKFRLVGICIGNSMICSDIWHKYHEWYFKIVTRNFTSR